MTGGVPGEVVIVVDMATSAARAVTIDAATGELLGFVGAPLEPPRRGPDGSSLQRADHPRVVRDLLRRTASLLTEHGGRVVAIGVTATSGTLLPLDATGVPAGDAVLYDDTSATAAAGRLAASGVPGGSGSVAARLLAVASLPGAAGVGTVADAVLADLAGHPVPSDTSHLLKAGIDPLARTFPEPLAALLPVPVPRLVHPGDRVGELGAAAAADTGLPAGIPLTAGMTDGCTAQIACGAVHPGDTAGVLGTTLVFKGVAAAPIASTDGAVYSHLAPDGRWWPGAASNAGAGVLAGAGGVDALIELDRAAAARGPAAVLRYPLSRTGERFPVADPAFTGIASGHPRDEVEAHRAVLDGVAFVERLGLERLAALGLELGDHRLVGGATGSPVWNRIRATVIGRPVLLPAAGGSAAGAAALACAAVTAVALVEVVERWAGAVTVVEPDPAERDLLEERYHRFVELLEQHSDLAAAPG